MGEMTALAVAQSPPLVVCSLDNLLSLECPKRRPMMGGWLKERHLVLLYAPSGVGKSYLVRIPIQSGQVFRSEAGHRSGMKPATIPQ